MHVVLVRSCCDGRYSSIAVGIVERIRDCVRSYTERQRPITIDFHVQSRTTQPQDRYRCLSTAGMSAQFRFKHRTPTCTARARLASCSATEYWLRPSFWPNVISGGTLQKHHHARNLRELLLKLADDGIRLRPVFVVLQMHEKETLVLAAKAADPRRRTRQSTDSGLTTPADLRPAVRTISSKEVSCAASVSAEHEPESTVGRKPLGMTTNR